MQISGNQLKENIKIIARRRGYTMKDLCQQIGMTENGLSAALINMTIKFVVIAKISEILDVSINSLVTIYGKETKNEDEYKTKYYESLEKIEKLRERLEQHELPKNKTEQTTKSQ